MIKVLIIGGLFFCHASMATQVTWLKTDWPPHQISSGVYQDKGTFDLLQTQVTARLPQFKHRNQTVNLARLQQAFQQNVKTVCSFGTIYTKERAATRLYSNAVAVLPGLAVHFRHSFDVQRHLSAQPDGAIDMLSLAQDASLTGAYQPNRYYPPSVVAASKYENFGPAEFGTDLNAATLLLSKRVDYVVEYPERMAFYLQQKKHKQSIQSFSVADASPFVVSYITCNQSAEAAQVIKSINAALTALWQTEDYQQAMFSWVDEQSKNSLQQAFHQTRLQVITGKPDSVYNPAK